MKILKVLGSGCKKCQQTAEILEQTARDLNLDVKVEKVIDPIEIMQYGVMSTPGVVIDETVCHVGSVPSRDQVKAMLA